MVSCLCIGCYGINEFWARLWDNSAENVGPLIESFDLRSQNVGLLNLVSWGPKMWDFWSVSFLLTQLSPFWDNNHNLDSNDWRFLTRSGDLLLPNIYLQLLLFLPPFFSDTLSKNHGFLKNIFFNISNLKTETMISGVLTILHTFDCIWWSGKKAVRYLLKTDFRR